MTDKELMQQALDALEHGLPIIEDYGGKEHIRLQHKAITVLYDALSVRLAQPEQEPEKNQDKPCVEDDGCPTEKAVLQRFWREHQAQPEQEPVAWHHHDCEGECIACLIERAIESEYGTQGVGYLRRHVTTTPPRKEWVGLTDKEIEDCLEMSIQGTCRAIEAKLKDKNA